ncbi:MAG: hypothetical protein GWP08_06700 [Nitrospiraceae bacterium]|nr:hypothetical protein [Nitrospiraceae bacterium]
MRISVITIFPELFREFLSTSLIGRAIASEALEVSVHNLRDFSEDKHQSVDDEPYGGGGGMVMMASPWIGAVRALRTDVPSRCVLMSPQGRRLTDARVQELAAGNEHLILLCGRYEGIELDWQPGQPGKYRVEAELNILDEWTPWIYTNPLELTPTT